MAGGNGQRTTEQCYGILVMVGRCGGDQNLGLIPSCISIVLM
jgi:hypothetical protein